MSAPTMFGAKWLMAQEFPPLQYVVPGIIPEGMSLLVAAPKIGKSWMVLGLGLALSQGGDAFGVLPVGKPRPVLYLALEDGPRRLQSRLRFMGVTTVDDRLQFQTAIENGQVVSTISSFIDAFDGQDPVVILDTLGKVMPPAGNGNQYGHDYAVLSALKSTCDAVPGSSLLIVHHTRKNDAGDFLDAVSGTQGIAGAADSVLVLRRERHEKRATLQVTSRDAVEGEYALTMSDAGVWTLDGDSLEQAKTNARIVKANKSVGEPMLELIETVSRYPDGIRSEDLRHLLPDQKNLNEYLRRAVEAGRVARPESVKAGETDSVRRSV
ncbi:AAA family ATPase [Microcella alkalica]|uniref:AAA family ATPase n=1 Tax=Microcella alkalica TaxID=355930 RepID=UPI00145C984D|nr:AAA family ATPase [Microcella alkalica]